VRIYDEITTLDHALTRPGPITRSYQCTQSDLVTRYCREMVIAGEEAVEARVILGAIG